jgi:thioredoxin reductase (NADPH)
MYTVITRNDCKYCDKAKAMLDLDKIPYVTYNVEEPSSRWVLSLMKEANIKTVPQIFAHDGSLIGGFRELETKMDFIGTKKEY